MTAGELARRLGVAVEGESGRELTGASPLETAGSGDLAFVAGAKGFAAAREAQAGCLIAPPDYEGPNAAVIRDAAPRRLFARALALLYPEPAVAPGVHPSATVGEGSVLGERVAVGPACVIGRGVTIGPGSVLYASVTIYDRVRIGRNAVLHSGCVIGADGFGFALDENRRYVKFPQVGTVEIGDDVEIGANSCVDRAALGATRIGDGTKIDNLVHVGHNCRIGRHVVIAAQTGLSGGVEIGDYAVVGGQVGVGDKARIEAGAVVGSGAGILTSKIVRAGTPVWGTPARPLKQYLEQLAVLSRMARKRK